MRMPVIVVIQTFMVMAGPLRAEGPLFGGQIALSLPQGDLNGGKWLHGRDGASAGLYSLIDLTHANALRPRADAYFYRSGQINIIDGGGNSQLFAENASARILAVAVDYNYFMYQHRFEGPYTILGLGYSWLAIRGAYLVPGGVGIPPTPWPEHQNAGSLIYAVGLGWHFSPRLGWEFRYTQSDFKDVATGFTIVKTPAFSLGLTVGF